MCVSVRLCKRSIVSILCVDRTYPLAALLRPVFLERVRLLHSRDQQSPQLASQRSLLLRSLFVVSLMCRHFDFDQVATEVPLPDLVSGRGHSINYTHVRTYVRACVCMYILYIRSMLPLSVSRCCQ